MEYGDLKQILSISEVGSDAACRVVISHRAAKLRTRRPPVWGIARQELQWSINQDGAWGISPLEYGGLQPILPFIEGRSDAACRVVIKTIRLHVWHGIRHGDDGVWRNADRNASCRGGVFAMRRFPRPPPPPSPPCAYHAARLPAHETPVFYYDATTINRDAPPSIAPRHATSLQTPPPPPPPRHPPHLCPTILLPGPLHPRISRQNPRVQRPR